MDDKALTLSDLKPGLTLAGVALGQVVTVAAAMPMGDAVDLIHILPDDGVPNREIRPLLLETDVRQLLFSAVSVVCTGEHEFWS